MAAFNRQARFLKSLGHPTRLRVVWMLRRDEACVCHLAAALHISQPAVSQHLMALRRSGAVSRRREGKNIYYRLSRSEIGGMLDLIDTITGREPGASNVMGGFDCTCPRCQAQRDATKVYAGGRETTPALETTGEKRI